MNCHRNSEGYRDPTAGAAFGRIIAEERRKHRKQRQEQAEAQQNEPKKAKPLRYLNVGKHRRCD